MTWRFESSPPHRFYAEVAKSVNAKANQVEPSSYFSQTQAQHGRLQIYVAVTQSFETWV